MGEVCVRGEWVSFNHLDRRDELACVHSRLRTRRALQWRNLSSAELTPQPLPSQHERIIKQADELELVYEERLDKIESESVERAALTIELRETLSELSILLGPGFESPPPLQPVPGSAPVTAAPSRAASRQSLGAAAALATQPPLLAPTTNTNKRTSGRRASNATAAELRNECWLDVSEDVLATTQAALDRALAERVGSISAR